MVCANCTNMDIVVVDKFGLSARCFKKTRKGREIYWANNRDLVIKAINKKVTAPDWCPLKN